MTRYCTDQVSQTIGTVAISGILATSILSGLNSPVVKPIVPRFSESGNYAVSLVTSPSTFETITNPVARAYQLHFQTDFEGAISSFFARLSSVQESLGVDFAEALYNDLWDLYQE